MRLLYIAALLALLAGMSATAQTWEQRVPRTTVSSGQYHPGLLQNHIMAYNGSGTTYLYGGNVSGGASSYDTWSWNGSAWQRIPTTANPTAATLMAGTFDSSRGVMFAFAGQGGTNEVWEFNGTNWTMPTLTGSQPSARLLSKCAFDPSAGVVVMYGGNNGVPLADTWIYDGSIASARWTQITASSSPGVRENHAMTYSPAASGVVLFGGRNGAAGATNDLWVYDMATAGWTLLHAGGASAPPAREYAALAYDATKGVLVLTKGSSSSTNYADVWEFNGTSWTDVTPSSPAGKQRGSSLASPAHAMVYDSVRAELVEVGRSMSDVAQTWTRSFLSPADRTLSRQYGPEGTNGPRAVTNESPVPSTTVTVHFENLPGTAGTIDAAVSLEPIANQSAGSLHIYVTDVLAQLTYDDMNPNPTQPLAIPGTLGVSYYYQALVTPSGGSAVYTNAIELRVAQ